MSDPENAPVPAQKMAYSVTMTGKPIFEYAAKPQSDGAFTAASVVRRLAFAAGATLLAFGLGIALSRRTDVSLIMATGAALMALSVPLRWDGGPRREK